MRILNNISLKNLNTFGLDVSAKYFVTVESEEDVLELLSSEIIRNEKWMVLGGGSNVLFRKDYNGLIIKNDIKGRTVEKNGGVKVGFSAGEDWDESVAFSVENNYWGIENLSWIPGKVGAAPIQNIGAYGVELKDVFHSVEFYNVENREKYTLGAEECQFGYRDSIFKNKLRGKIIITKVHLNLSEIPNPILEYNGIISAFESKKITEPTLTEIRNLIIEIRKSKLPDPYFLPNAGSFFKNPVIGQEQYIELLEEFPKIPAFVNDKNRYKIPAAWLIEQTGLKGFKKGKVGTHQNQPLVILNLGYKKGQRIIDFANYVTREVKNKFGIKLEKEVNIV